MVGWVKESDINTADSPENKNLSGFTVRANGNALDKTQGLVRALEGFIDSMVEPVLLVTPNGQVVGVNAAAAEWFGIKYPLTYSRVKIDYVELIQGICVDQDQLMAKDLPVNAALREGVACSSAVTLHLATRGVLITKMIATPVRDEEGRMACVVLQIHDITEKVRYNRARDEFLYIASHELRNPLGVARGLIQLIQMRFKQRAELTPRLVDYLPGCVSKNWADLFDFQKDIEQLNGVLRNIDQMSQVIYELLDISRLESGRLHLNNRPLELIQLVEEVSRKMQTTTNRHQIKNTTVKTQFNQGQCWVFGDSFRLEQVMVNLIANAIKYSPAGGVIEVSLRKDGDQVIFSVSDRGIGISQEDQQRLFEKFYRVSHSNGVVEEGLGLGLYISTQIIKEHGGKLWVTSELGQGSTFSFSLLEDDEMEQ
ncbi:MAG: PAS domain-containing protein [Syntrophomonadaceae bacterium]|nr:PAS domain-containing protein [Syntrophomonadaceae bacterium]